MAVLYKVWGGLTGAEISRVLGCATRQATYVALRKAKVRLARMVTIREVTNSLVTGERKGQAA